MLGLIVRRSPKTGLPPGSLVHVGGNRGAQTRVTTLHYDAQHDEELPGFHPPLAPADDPDRVTWIQVQGLHDVALLEPIGSHFRLHPLIMEDILDTNQYPKIDDLEDYLLIVLKRHQVERRDDERMDRVEVEQISILLGQNWVITFQEMDRDIFAPIKERIHKNEYVRRRGADYLAYTLLDLIVDGYYDILEDVGEEIEDVEQNLVDQPSREQLHDLHGLKRNMLVLRRSIWPMREILSRLEEGETAMIRPGTQVYLDDVHDHIVQIIDMIEVYREMLSSMLDVYLSGVSNRMNEIMKVLTIISTIFMPLTFIAGVYGMNFRFMPEIDQRWAYPAVLVLMAVIALSMLVYFRRKGWL